MLQYHTSRALLVYTLLDSAQARPGNKLCTINTHRMFEGCFFFTFKICIY